MNQFIPFKSIGLPNESVSVIRISDITVLETGLNKDLLGSKLKGYDLVRSSVGIMTSVVLNRPSIMLSVIVSQLMLMTSILLVILGNFELY